MQKKLEAELMSIAHDILRMKNRDDLKVLKQKAYETYEKLAVLSYVQDFVKETPQNKKTVEELTQEVFLDSDIEENIEVISVEKSSEELDQKVDEVEVEDSKLIESIEDESLDLFTDVKDEEEEVTNLQTSLEKEFGSTVSLDVATDMFENATRVVSQKKSINDVVMSQKNLQIDLNDRIAFVKHLFEGSQEDFNRVVSQLNSMSNEKEALSFLKMVKKEYHWGGKEIYEDRLILLIERKFN